MLILEKLERYELPCSTPSSVSKLLLFPFENADCRFFLNCIFEVLSPLILHFKFEEDDLPFSSGLDFLGEGVLLLMFLGFGGTAGLFGL